MTLCISQIPADSTKEELLEALPILGGFTERQWDNISAEHISLVEHTLMLNNLTISQAVKELGLVRLLRNE